MALEICNDSCHLEQPKNTYNKGVINITGDRAAEVRLQILLQGTKLHDTDFFLSRRA